MDVEGITTGWPFSVGPKSFRMCKGSFVRLLRNGADMCNNSGRRILELQTSLALLNSSAPLPPHLTSIDHYGRQPFRHPALDVSQHLNHEVKDKIFTYNKLADLGFKYGLLAVVRWKPRKVSFAAPS